MLRLKSLFAALALSLSALTVIAPVAVAQGSVVVTIDEARIIRDSLAGKDIQTKLNAIETQMKAELEPDRASLEADATSLNGKLQGKTREQVAADATLIGELQAYEQQANAFARKRAIVSQEYQLTERQALFDFNKALEPVLTQVIAEKNAEVVLSRSVAVYAGDSVDATPSIISKLDAATPTINVVRKKMPEQPAAQ